MRRAAVSRKVYLLSNLKQNDFLWRFSAELRELALHLTKFLCKHAF